MADVVLLLTLYKLGLSGANSRWLILQVVAKDIIDLFVHFLF